MEKQEPQDVADYKVAYFAANGQPIELRLGSGWVYMTGNAYPRSDLAGMTQTLKSRVLAEKMGLERLAVTQSIFIPKQQHSFAEVETVVIAQEPTEKEFVLRELDKDTVHKVSGTRVWRIK